MAESNFPAVTHIVGLYHARKHVHDLAKLIVRLCGDRHARPDGKIAILSVARKLARRCYHNPAQRRSRPRVRHARNLSSGPGRIDTLKRPI